MSLLRLPTELIHQCSFHVIAHDPLGPPQAIITLALTCRAFHLVVSSHAFKARVCRFMFDIRPVTRRLFHPRDSDLADELHRCCNVLKEIRRADVAADSVDSLVDDTLLSAYFLMLSNDGKNYAQLEHAGLDAYVNKFVTTRLWEGSEENQGWPLDNFINSVAMWLMWMTLTKQKLAAESLDARKKMTELILPYVVLPHRYTSASAPPNHFNLPLDPQNPYHQQPLFTIAAPELPYPIYISDQSCVDMAYFNVRIPVCSPLITIAAKLLFVARKEIFPITPPPHLPQAPGPGIVGFTQEDFRELNRSPGARLCRVVTWNWDTGSPNRVGGEDGEIEEDWEESKVWDTEWWRRLLCRNCNTRRPKYLPGDVFKLGSMGGSWHGKEYVPQGQLFRHFLRRPNVHYPGIPDAQFPDTFTETSIGLSVKPLFLDIQEHHKICECPQGSSNVSESHPYVAPTHSFSREDFGVPSSSSSSLPIVPQSGRCGIVPIPAPHVFPRAGANGQEAGQNEEEQETDEPQASDALDLTFATPRLNVIDYSMTNAWFPGRLGGVSFTKPPNITAEDGKRDKIICAVDYQAPDIRNVLNRPEESKCLSLGGRRGQEVQGKMNVYVYETYDPEKTSMHRGLAAGDSISDDALAFTFTSSSNDDPHKCQRCLQREALIRLERKKAEHRSKMMLDRGLRSYDERGGGYDWNQDDDYDDEDMDETGDEEMEMEDVDVDELGIDMDGIIAETTLSSEGSEGSESSMQIDDDDDDDSSSQMISFGDNIPESYMHDDEEFRQRRCYDKCRIGVECKGVADVLLSGETGLRHAAFHQFKMYGRIRPYDGLIGILRSAYDVTNNSISNIFMFGYIIADANFVGEWRVAADDPLRPTWGGAFVMSKKVDRGGRGGGQQA